MEYKKTLNLPKTDMPIRANLKKVEEECLAFWRENNIYHKMIEKNMKKNKFILHDGPPYPNGHIHLGHALNKILKDIVIKFKTLEGFYSPYVPGWDCHGLPIETQLIKELGKERHNLSTWEFREKCKEYALKYVDLQKAEFIRLGVFAAWETPYLTLKKTYEKKIIDVFFDLLEKGYVYRGLKPIHWCPNCKTALAEAEIEYADEKSPSIFVKFKLNSKLSLDKRSPLNSLDLPVYFIIWTTTPWTLPANVAIAAHPDYEYSFIKVGNEIWVIADGLLEQFIEKLEIKDHKVIDKTKGKFLEGLLFQHPFLKRESVLVLDKYVTLEQGTGLVHIAPGHGEEDYKVGLNYKLEVVMPVDEEGKFDKTFPKLTGQRFDEANKTITSWMKENGTLLKLEFMKHSYPHCWRCKKPVIFRATEQWFIKVDYNRLREKTLEAIGKVNWFPKWGETRIRAMVEGRPDWCLSRQRSWGVPIPVLYCKKCKKLNKGKEFIDAAKKIFEEEGSNGWFKYKPEEILKKGSKCEFCQSEEFVKEMDILDVWFESGTSHAAVLEDNKDLNWPADLYLEGSDQHRGWFQTSILTAMSYKNAAPYRSVLTHGFTVDEKGKKQSKSLGNVIDPQDVIKKYGADVLRLWVAATDFRSDLALSEKILKQVQDAYLKIRNTLRFLISNLSNFSEKEKVDPKKLLEIDRWILDRLQRLIQKAHKAYDEYNFHIVFRSVYEFCVTDLSAFYLDMSKDRLYCNGKDSIERKSAQFAIFNILISLLKLLAPILSFTCESVMGFLPEGINKPKSVFMVEMPVENKAFLDNKIENKWNTILEVREKVYKKLEEARNNKIIYASLEAKVIIKFKGEAFKILNSVKDLLPMIFIASQVELSEGEEDIKITKAGGKKCDRCWMFSESVGKTTDHPTLCERCSDVVTKM